MSDSNKISKAPPPIEPLRGDRSILTKPKDERLPRWNKWRLMQEVQIWEAVSLSLNIEPEKTKTDHKARIRAAHPFIEGEEFEDRLTILNQHSSNWTYFPTRCAPNAAWFDDEVWYQREVRLDEFASWALTVAQWEIPDELKSIAAKGASAVIASVPVAGKVGTAQTNKLRRNSLDPAIDKAIKNAGSNDSAAVFLALRELALAEEKPFTGEIEGDVLCYTDDDNKPAKLTKNALKQRLKRR